jgi:hypothetical protein
MNFDEFEKANDDDLKAEAKRCFDESRALTPADLPYKAPLMLEAQFYMQERDRRDSSRVALRDLRLEVVVIVLIGIEIVLSVVGIVIAIREGNAQATLTEKQTGILTSLQQSSSDTAGTLKGLLETTGKMNISASSTAGTLQNLEGTTKAMNKAAQAQLSLFYDPSIALTYDSALNRVLLTNTGRTRLTVTSLKVNGVVANIAGMKVIAAGTNMYLEFAEGYKHYSSTLIKGSSLNVPIGAHLENENRKHFVLNGNLFFVWENDKVTVHGQSMSVLPEQ